MKIAFLVALLFLATAASQQAKFLPARQSAPKAAEPAPKAPDNWLVSFSNVSKDPDQNYGHGEGDELMVIVHGETAVGELSELEGSQEDPPPMCMTGTFRGGVLELQNYPGDFRSNAATMTVRGKIYKTPHGHAFRGRITGGPFHSEANSTDPHFPAIVTLRSLHGEQDNTPNNIADYFANGSCACEWKKHVAANSFITAKCDAPAAQ